MGGSEVVAQEYAGVQLALTELKLAHAALDSAEAATEADVRCKYLSRSRRAHTLAMQYLARLAASEDAQCALQGHLRWLEVRLERMSGEGRDRAAAAA